MTLYINRKAVSSSVIDIPKEGFKRIGFEIPEELHSRLTNYNKTATRPINVGRLMVNIIEEELKKEGV